MRIAALLSVLAIMLALAVHILSRTEVPARPTRQPQAVDAVAEVAIEPVVSTLEENVDESGEDDLVDDFDAETDKWIAADKTKQPSIQDVYSFAAKFKALPDARKEECLQRALNLVPDENVMLLVGILMDKTQKKGIAELVFGDILNRPEDVKKPVLEQILADETHPCHDDAEWIFAVTGERVQGDL